MSSRLPKADVVCWLCFLLITFSPAVLAQRPQPLPGRLGLQQLARSSGYIFAGTVTEVAQTKAKKANQVGTVRVTFHVDRAIRGVRTGQSFSIREWAGLWQSGERYQVGQKLLLFLYRPSRLGLTSAIGGPLGRMPLDGKGNVLQGYKGWSLLPDDPERAEPARRRSPLNARDLAERVRRMAEE